MAAKKTKRPMTKAQLIQAIADATGSDINKRQIKEVLEALQVIGYKQLRKNGVFAIPGFAKLEVKRRKKTKGGVRNVFGEERFVPSRPATKRVSARAIKACQDAVG